MPQPIFPFKLGSDPEFSFVIQGRRVRARDIMRLNLNRKKEFKADDQGFKVEGHGNVGWDGCDSTAELRPKAENDPKLIVEHIRGLITPVHERMPLFEMSTLSLQAPVGGHIHFQLDAETRRSQQKVALIHKKIASFFLPIMMSENKINLRIRAKSSYGSLTDFHGDNHFVTNNGDDEFTYEFRTPSAEWLTTPKICEATFAYLGTVYNEIINNPNNFKKYADVVYKNEEQAKALHQLAISDYIGITESIFNRIKKAVRTFATYNDYKDQIEYILNPKKVMEDKKKANYDMTIGWNLKAPVKAPTVKQLLSDKAFAKAASGINLDEMAPLINITYNDDTNVSLFTKELSEKSIAFNWKLKQNYFIFGLRKGVDKAIVFDQDKNILKGLEMIETTSDKTALEDMVKRMINKYNSQSGAKTIDPYTGEIKNNSFIAVGLPYEERLAKNTKNFLHLIYQLEKGRLKPELARKSLIEDNSAANSARGKFWKIMNNEEVGLPLDNNSQGYNRAVSAKSEIIREEIRDERNNNENLIPTCPSCGSTDYRMHTREDRVSRNTFYHCTMCGYNYEL